MILGQFETKVINLNSRPERMAETVIELEKINISHVWRFPAIKGGESGCAKSHYECLKGDGNLFLFEDDVVFEPNAEYHLRECIKQLPDNFDLFYIGANVKSPAVRYSESLYKITGGVHCTHAILYSAKGRKRMIELWDPASEQIHQIDHWMYMIGQGLMECYVANPLIAFQRPAYSDIRLQWFDYRGEMIENAKNNMI
jgi:GR25 family glycosyltransferase involved in LPS biosynthesis